MAFYADDFDDKIRDYKLSVSASNARLGLHTTDEVNMAIANNLIYYFCLFSEKSSQMSATDFVQWLTELPLLYQAYQRMEYLLEEKVAIFRAEGMSEEDSLLAGQISVAMHSLVIMYFFKPNSETGELQLIVPDSELTNVQFYTNIIWNHEVTAEMDGILMFS